LLRQRNTVIDTINWLSVTNNAEINRLIAKLTTNVDLYMMNKTPTKSVSAHFTLSQYIAVQTLS